MQRDYLVYRPTNPISAVQSPWRLVVPGETGIQRRLLRDAAYQPAPVGSVGACAHVPFESNKASKLLHHHAALSLPFGPHRHGTNECALFKVARNHRWRRLHEARVSPAVGSAAAIARCCYRQQHCCQYGGRQQALRLHLAHRTQQRSCQRLRQHFMPLISRVMPAYASAGGSTPEVRCSKVRCQHSPESKPGFVRLPRCSNKERPSLSVRVHLRVCEIVGCPLVISCNLSSRINMDAWVSRILVNLRSR